MSEPKKLPTLWVDPTDEAYMHARSAEGLGFTVMASLLTKPEPSVGLVYVPRALLDAATTRAEAAEREVAALRAALTGANQVAMDEAKKWTGAANPPIHAAIRVANAVNVYVTAALSAPRAAKKPTTRGDHE